MYVVLSPSELEYTTYINSITVTLLQGALHLAGPHVPGA